MTASCTDGNTYVYDSALGDQAIHILNHGGNFSHHKPPEVWKLQMTDNFSESLDNPLHDIGREQGDTGVKFAAWGQNKTRFYTGASDGKVKAWDVTAAPRHAFVKDVLVLSGGVSAGAFSHDHSQLLIGDATGKVHLMRVDDWDILDPPHHVNQHIKGRHLLKHGGVLPSGIKRPKVIIPHAEPAPPKEHHPVASILDEQSGPEIAHQLVKNGLIEIRPDPWIGAVQGPRYSESSLFHYDAHEGQDGTAPLLPEWQRKQRIHIYNPSRRDLQIPTLEPVPLYGSDISRHRKNLQLDLDLSTLSLETRGDMRRERWEMDWEEIYAEEMSPGEEFEIFKPDKQVEVGIDNDLLRENVP